MDPSPAVRVVLVAEDPLARSGLHAALASQPTVQVVAQVAPEDVPAAVQTHRPEVAAWDLGLDPRAALARMRSTRPESLPVLALVPGDQAAADALGAGARGALLREASARKLASALVALGCGSLVIDEALATAVIPARLSAAERPSETLTTRELEVLQLLAQGLGNKQIAARLGISEHTAKFHVNAILSKLGVQSRTEAVVQAARLGLVVL